MERNFCCFLPIILSSNSLSCPPLSTRDTNFATSFFLLRLAVEINASLSASFAFTAKRASERAAKLSPARLTAELSDPSAVATLFCRSTFFIFSLLNSTWVSSKSPRVDLCLAWKSAGQFPISHLAQAHQDISQDQDQQYEHTSSAMISSSSLLICCCRTFAFSTSIAYEAVWFSGF